MAFGDHAIDFQARAFQQLGESNAVQARRKDANEVAQLVYLAHAGLSTMRGTHGDLLKRFVFTDEQFASAVASFFLNCPRR